MPASEKFSHRILPEHRLCLLRYIGRISLTDVIHGVNTLRVDPAYNCVYNGIVNLDGVTTRGELQDLRTLIRFLQQRRASIGQWVVVFSEPRATTHGVLFKAAWRGTFNIEVVSTWEAACRFLRVDLPAFAPERHRVGVGVPVV